jgi:ssDNA-binding Zn-finger/Zn-ribbon topoisomerase 1
MAEIKFVEGAETELTCPNCLGAPRLIVRTNRRTGHQFLGCQRWPECDFCAEIPESMVMQALGQPTLFDVEGKVDKLQ